MPTRVTLYGFELQQSGPRKAARIASWCRGHAGTERSFCHGTLKFSYPEDRVQLVAFVRNEYGHLTAKSRITCTTCASRLLRIAVNKLYLGKFKWTARKVNDHLFHFHHLGPYSATRNSCQVGACRFLRSPGVPIPEQLQTFGGLLGEQVGAAAASS